MSEHCRLLFVGDIALEDNYASRFGGGCSGWIAPFVDILPVFRQADVRIGNLEGPLHRSSNPRPKRNLLGASAESACALGFLGFSALSLGNNHITDQGREGVIRTREVLESEGIQPFGAGETIQVARRPAFVRARGQSFAFLAYSVQGGDVGSEVATDESEGCVPLTMATVEEDVARLRGAVDHVVVSLHWGYQYDHFPAPEQVVIAREIIDRGAVIVFGHHPHVVQGYERYKNGLILYSLGNFFFPDFTRADGLRFRFPKVSRTTAAALVGVGDSGVESFSMLPLRVDRHLRMRPLEGMSAVRQRRRLEALAGALDRGDYESFWRSRHRRTVKARARQEAAFAARIELATLCRQVRNKGFVASITSLKARRVPGVMNLLRRLTRLH